MLTGHCNSQSIIHSRIAIEQAQSLNETQEVVCLKGCIVGKEAVTYHFQGKSPSSREVVKDIMGRDDMNKDANHESK